MKFVFSLMVVLGFAATANAGNYYCNKCARPYQPVYQQPVYNAPPVNIEIVTQHDQYFKVVPQPIVEIQKIEREVIPQQVNYLANPLPEKIQTIDKIRIIQNHESNQIKVQVQPDSYSPLQQNLNQCYSNIRSRCGY